MAQWFAIVYKTGSLAGDVRSYGTVITDPLNTTLYEAVAVNGPPGPDETWDIATKTIIRKPTPTLTRREQLKALSAFTTAERDEAIRALL